MTKQKLRVLASVGIILVVYLVLAFAIPFVKTGAFWLSLLFTVIAILTQLHALSYAFDKGVPPKSRFYGYPIARVGIIYLIVQLAAGFTLMTLAAIAPGWLALIVFAIILVAAALGLITMGGVRDEIIRQDTVLKKDTSLMRGLQAKSNVLVNLTSAPELKGELQKLAEKLRFSDPVSNEALAGIEAELSACMDELRTAVAGGEIAAALSLCKRAGELLEERNQMCKAGK